MEPTSVRVTHKNRERAQPGETRSGLKTFSHHFSRHWCCICVCFNSRARLEWRDRKCACHPGYREPSERSLQTLDSSHDDEPAGRPSGARSHTRLKGKALRGRRPASPSFQRRSGRHAGVKGARLKGEESRGD